MRGRASPFHRIGEAFGFDPNPSNSGRGSRTGCTLRYSRRAGGIVIGGLIVAVGLMILLDNMGIVRFHDVWRYWPVLLIVFGVSRILESRAAAGYIWGGVLTLAGALLLLDNLDIVVFDFNLVWPLLIIAFGLSMLLRSMDRKRYLASATGAPGDTG